MSDIESKLFTKPKSTLDDSDSEQNDSEQNDSEQNDSEQNDSDSDTEINVDNDVKNNILSQIDRKILIKIVPDGKNKRNRTHIHGLDYYITKEEQNKFCKDLQKKLGTALILATSNEKNVYIFSGDHKDKVVKALVGSNIVAKNEID
jgi:hypothetical protein